MIRIAIINAVPINGGDEALLKATLLGLKEHLGNISIHVLCNNPTMYKSYFPDIEMDWDWEYAFLRPDTIMESLFFKIKRKIRKTLKKHFKISYFDKISMLLASKRERRVYQILYDSNKIILSAGGYFHDFYGYDKRVNTLNFIHDHLKKPYYIFSQSVGPFWKKENHEELRKIFRDAEKVILREEYSLKHLRSIGCTTDNVLVTNDVAFYLYKKYGRKANLDKQIQQVAVNFREWKYEKESKDLLQKAVSLCTKLIASGYTLTFISTCQGVKGYIDDSVFARKIVNELIPSDREKCEIIQKKLSLEDLIHTLSGMDAYIGMRLHGALLSLMAGTPAVNIAYEDKSLGVFESLGLGSYCFSYKEETGTWHKSLDHFKLTYEKYLKKVDQVNLDACNRVEANFIELNKEFVKK